MKQDLPNLQKFSETSIQTNWHSKALASYMMKISIRKQAKQIFDNAVKAVLSEL